jgi:two-component system, OmpR family, phosphate regulon response regulator PhoB
MSNPVVLIVSEDSDFHSSLRQRLNEMGCHALCVANDKRCLNWAEEFRPEVVLISDSRQGESREIHASIIRSFPERRPIFLLLPEPSDLLADVTDNAGSDGTLDLDSMADVVGKLACLRHHRLTSNSSFLSCNGLEIDRQRHRATVHGRDLRLTVTEFQLVWTLASRPGFVHTREQLFESCQRGRNGAQLRTVDAHIKAIRRKLREHAGVIQTIRGIGYCFQGEKTENDSAEWSDSHTRVKEERLRISNLRRA